ncbi:MAG: hypothetical protein WBS33_06050 [Verrucomicrobiia bacterium]
MKTLQPIRRCDRLLLAFACVWLAAFTAGTAHSQLVLTDLGVAAPTPGPYDISQLLTTGDTAPYTTDGINYYDNNSGDSAPGSSGQTFTTDSLTEGYVLTNLVIKFGGWNPNGNDFNGNPQGWRIEIFQLEDANSFASLIYSNQTSGADINHGPQDWLQFSGMAVQLSPNTTYAYTIINTTNTSSSSDDLGYAKQMPYTGGAVCRILSVGGSVAYYSFDNISAAFDAGLAPFGPPYANQPTVSPSTIPLGSPATFSESAVGATPLYYQWQTDGGSGVIFTNIPGATSSNLNFTPAIGGTFQFDIVVTNILGSVTSAPVTLTVVPPAGIADVTVKLSQPLSPLPAAGLGVCTATYDNVLIDSRIAPLLNAAGISAVRYPGGSYADIFNWQTTTANDGGYVNASDTFANFMNTVVNPAGAQAIVTINYGSNPADNAGGDTNVAAAWVAYANLTNQWGVKYWEIGNEIYGNGFYGTSSDWEYDLHFPETNAATRVRQPALSPSAYGSNSVAFIQAMKAEDPNIKCGVFIQQPGVYPDTDATAPWNLSVLTNCANDIDFVILHYYPNGSASSILAQPPTIPSMVQSVYAEMAGEIGSTLASRLGLAITETGGGTNTGVVVSLWAADNYLGWVENGAFNVDYQILHDDILEDNQTPAHAYYGAQMAHLLANTNDTLVTAASDQSLVHVHAASRQDGRVGVMLLNTSPNATITVNVSIFGSALATNGTAYIFGATNFIGADDFPSYPVATNAVSGLGNSLTIAVPAYTMIDLLIPTAASPPVLAAISNSTVNVGQIVSFTASATDTNQPSPKLTFNLLTGPTNASVNSTSGLFNWRPLTSQANSTNQFVLTVTANSTPSLSATQSFAIAVNPIRLPTLTQAAVSNGQFSLTLNGIAGPDYAIQVSSNLTVWQSVFSTNSPALPLTWFDTNLTAPMRFYRATLGPPLPP